MSDNIILTGFMGTGKTQVGRRLAKRLGWRFIDTDLLIEQELDTSIRQLFAEKGEAYFRPRNRNQALDLIASIDSVFSERKPAWNNKEPKQIGCNSGHLEKQRAWLGDTQ